MRKASLPPAGVARYPCARSNPRLGLQLSTIGRVWELPLWKPPDSLVRLIINFYSVRRKCVFFLKKTKENSLKFIKVVI